MNDGPTHVKDARGIPVPAGPHQRVVSLVPSLTDAVFGLGAGSKLVGRTIYCCEPRSKVQDIPTFGGTKNPDLEGILTVAPDLVLACVEENQPDHLCALAEAGLAVFAVMPRSLDDVSLLLRDFGVLLDASAGAGKSLADLTAARLAAGEFRVGHSAPLRAVTLIWKKPWMAVGGGNHINAVMTEFGLENVLAGREGYFEIALEDLARRDLDLVLLPDEPFRFTHHDSWSLAAADVVASRKRALLMDGKLLSWYGTRTARSLRALIKLFGSLSLAE